MVVRGGWIVAWLCGVLAGCGAEQVVLEDGDAPVDLRDPMALVEDARTVLDSDDGLVLRSVREDAYGGWHVRLDQYHRGVRVFEGEAIAHYDEEGWRAGVTDSLARALDVDVQPAYDADEAVDLAVEAAHPDGWEVVSDKPGTELVVLRRGGVDRLVWKVQLRHLGGNTEPAMPLVFVDAHDGDIAWSFDNLQSLGAAACSGPTVRYGDQPVDCLEDGGVYYLEDLDQRLGTYTWNGTTTDLAFVTAGGTTIADPTSVESHWGMQRTYDYYAVYHGRIGIDGAAGPQSVGAHGVGFMGIATRYDQAYVNAHWDGAMIAIGDGDGTSAGPFSALDVVAHEYTHGVTQFEAGLTYAGESGGLNESMSDVFASAVDRVILGPYADPWLIGESVATPSVAGDAFRSMSNPSLDGASLDWYDAAAAAAADVHYSSGIGNLAFYLASVGGTHPRGMNTVRVTPLGADAAAAVWYLALSSYMTASTNYAGARAATLSATAQIYGAGTDPMRNVGEAWSAVGVKSSCRQTSSSSRVSSVGSSVYLPNSSRGSALHSGDTVVTLSGPSRANFDIYLQKKNSSGSWTTVASSRNSRSSETIRYTSRVGAYRVRIKSVSGTGSFTMGWCKPD
ncbi:MAG: hypothetical protein RLZZ299_233 [Pseudomonadota bacterium]|jgi:vibriolysin